MCTLKLPDPTEVSMLLYSATESEIESTISHLHNKTSSGVDKISSCVVKLTSVVPFLTVLINQSFRQGKFPDALKKAKISPIHKSGSKLDENNYRPIALRTVWSKVFERIMYNRVYYYFQMFDLFYDKQFGFRKKHSCIDALAEMTERLRHDQNRSSMNFFLDLKKAFDTLDLEILLKKTFRLRYPRQCFAMV